MSRLAVIVPIHKILKYKSDIFSLKNTIYKLYKRDIYLLAPVKLKEWISEMVVILEKEFKKEIYVLYLKNYFFKSRLCYNKIMLDINFYKKFINYDYLLVVQTDALVIKDDLDEWMLKNYSYIGAPWFEGWDKPSKPYKFLGSGNGGFSLRKISDFIEVLYKPRYIPNTTTVIDKNKPRIIYMIDSYYDFFWERLIYSYNFFPLFPRIYEDTFWGILVPKNCSFFKVPSPEEAAFFSFEVNPEYLYKLINFQLPTGCHGWEKYGYIFWKEVLKETELYDSIP